MFPFIAKSCLGLFIWLLAYFFVSAITKRLFPSTRPRWNARRRRYLANPLWPLEELRDLRDPPFVADPEFAPFKIEALRYDSQTSDVSSIESPFYRFKREFPIPKLVTGLPWRYLPHIDAITAPEGDFVPLDLSWLSKGQASNV
jgi:hypothetical protein